MVAGHLSTTFLGFVRRSYGVVSNTISQGRKAAATTKTKLCPCSEDARLLHGTQDVRTTEFAPMYLAAVKTGRVELVSFLYYTFVPTKRTADSG